MIKIDIDIDIIPMGDFKNYIPYTSIAQRRVYEFIERGMLPVWGTRNLIKDNIFFVYQTKEYIFNRRLNERHKTTIA